MQAWKCVGKMSLYVFISTIISFVSLIDTMDAHYFDQISDLDWIKIVMKSMVPGLISLKAYLDTSLTDKPVESNVQIITEKTNK